jgi:hypothetical protein
VCRQNQGDAIKRRLARFHFLLHLGRMANVLVKAVTKQGID